MGMKVRTKIELIDWIWEGSHSRPSMLRSMSCAWKIHDDPVWSNSDQNTAMKEKRMTSLPEAFSPAALNVSRRNFLPPAGTWTKRLRPIQNTTVARAMRTPGTPNARCGPHHFSNQGVSNMEMKAPRLMEK